MTRFHPGNPNLPENSWWPKNSWRLQVVSQKGIYSQVDASRAFSMIHKPRSFKAEFISEGEKQKSKMELMQFVTFVHGCNK
jgi:hypothetical protein